MATLEKLSRELFKIKPNKLIRFDFQDMEIIVLPEMNLQDKIILIGSYLSKMEDIYDFKNPVAISTTFVEAEYGLILGLISHCTNIDITPSENDSHKNVDVDEIVSSGLWDAIKSKMPYYESFRKDLENALNIYHQKKSVDKSLGSSLEYVFDRLNDLVDKANSLNGEEAKELQSSVSNLMKELNKLNKKFPGIMKE